MGWISLVRKPVSDWTGYKDPPCGAGLGTTIDVDGRTWHRALTHNSSGRIGGFRIFIQVMSPHRAKMGVRGRYTPCMNQETDGNERSEGQEHLLRPHLRQFQPLPVQSPEGKQLVLLRDPLNLVPKPLVMVPEALRVMAQFQGQRTVHEIAEQFSIPLEKVEELVSILDSHALLWGPVFTEKEQELKASIAASGRMPRGAAFMLGEEEAKVREQLEAWLAETEDPELESPPLALVVPHLDYHRGWPLYAAGYKCLEGMSAPDRVVVLGTNHFGIGDGCVATEWSWESPLGDVRVDEALVEAMRSRLGKGFYADQLDHIPEHSVQLHLPWIKYVFGDVPVFGVLVPDPNLPMVEDDGQRTAGTEFISALREALAELGGTTFFIASSDLSHVGPQFGEPAAVDDERKVEVEKHDREMLAKFLEGDAGAFTEAMNWSKNPTRWCSVGNMSALVELIGSENELELLDYRQAVQENGAALVSAAACVVL